MKVFIPYSEELARQLDGQPVELVPFQRSYLSRARAAASPKRPPRRAARHELQ
jgi:hypothetical protein